MVPTIQHCAQEMLVSIIIFVLFHPFNGGGGCFFSWQANDKYLLTKFSGSGTMLGTEEKSEEKSTAKTRSPLSKVSV